MALSAQQSLGEANDGQVQIEYQFDTVSLVVQTLTVINNGTFGTLGYNITNRSDGSEFVFAGLTNPGTLAAKAGSHTFDISSANLVMTTTTGPKGTVQQLPVDVQLSWSSTLAA